MRSVRARLEIDQRCEVGESPYWDWVDKRLLWIDVYAGRIHEQRLDGSVATIQLDGPVGAVAARAGGGLVAALADGVALFDTFNDLERFIPVEADLPDHRLNDAKVDRLGRLWAGTMHR